MSAETTDRNDLAFWFPRISTYGVPVPETVLIQTEADLLGVLDGKEPDGWEALVTSIQGAGDSLGWPCFLRTGHGSGKHQWRDTCFVRIPEDVSDHVCALVEWSALVDIMGLPTHTWAVRRLIDTRPLFRCERYGGMPITREFRLFVNDEGVYHHQPYWPPDAVRRGGPTNERWEALLKTASELGPGEATILKHLAMRAQTGVGGGDWSVDLLQGRNGKWWVTDMAVAADSFRWEP